MMKTSNPAPPLPSKRLQFALLLTFCIGLCVYGAFLGLKSSTINAQKERHVIFLGETPKENGKEKKFVSLKSDGNVDFQVSPSQYPLPSFPVDCVTSDNWRSFADFYSKLSATQKKQLLADELVLSVGDLKTYWLDSSFPTIFGYEEGAPFSEFFKDGEKGVSRYAIRIQPALITTLTNPNLKNEEMFINGWYWYQTAVRVGNVENYEFPRSLVLSSPDNSPDNIPSVEIEFPQGEVASSILLSQIESKAHYKVGVEQGLKWPKITNEKGATSVNLPDLIRALQVSGDIGVKVYPEKKVIYFSSAGMKKNLSIFFTTPDEFETFSTVFNAVSKRYSYDFRGVTEGVYAFPVKDMPKDWFNIVTDFGNVEAYKRVGVDIRKLTPDQAEKAQNQWRAGMFDGYFATTLPSMQIELVLQKPKFVDSKNWVDGRGWGADVYPFCFQ